jgi:hypothetical protein
MSTRHPSFEIHNHGRRHLDPFSMDYINRVLDRYSRTSRRPHLFIRSAPPDRETPTHTVLTSVSTGDTR